MNSLVGIPMLTDVYQLMSHTWLSSDIPTETPRSKAVSSAVTCSSLAVTPPVQSMRAHTTPALCAHVLTSVSFLALAFPCV